MKTICYGLIFVFFCQPDKTPVIDSYCEVAKIIRPSRQDTPNTLKAILAENAKIRKICKKG